MSPAAEPNSRLAHHRRLHALMAAAGYPDPDTIRQERTIWHAASGQIPTNRVCSTSSVGMVTMSSPEIQQIVRQVYSGPLRLPAHWTPPQCEEFLDSEASRLSHQIAELAAEMGAQAVGEWTRTHHGAHPDYLTKVGLLNSAHNQAKEIVLSEQLYEQTPPEPDPPSTLWGEDQPEPDRQQTPWDQRWTRPALRTEPSPDIEALIAHLWPEPTHSGYFRIKAGYLLAARAEDQLELPSGPHDPLTAQLALMISHDIREDGLPER